MDSCSRTASQSNATRAALTWRFVAAISAFLAPAALAQMQLEPPSSGLINPRAIVFSPATKKVYAVDSSQGEVQIYADPGSEMHRVKVGAAPVSIAVNSASGRVYVANAGDGTVSVIDGKSDLVMATIPIGSHPYSIAADSATGKVYVTHTFGDQLTILDGATNTAVEVKTGSSDLIAINSRTATIYLLGYGGAVMALDGTSHKMTSLPVGRHAWALTLNDATGTVYVARIEDADLAAVNGHSSGISILPAGAIPCAIAVNSKADTLYVANYGDGTVTVINSTTGRATATIPVGEHPKAIAFDPISNQVYVANTSSGTVTVIDAENVAVVATLPAGKNPYALAVAPGSNSLYVANEADGNSSTVVDLSLIRKASLAPAFR
jgi:YVTN family beta-propeller protein